MSGIHPRLPTAGNPIVLPCGHSLARAVPSYRLPEREGEAARVGYVIECATCGAGQWLTHDWRRGHVVFAPSSVQRFNPFSLEVLP